MWCVFHSFVANMKDQTVLRLWHGTYSTDPRIIFRENSAGFNVNYAKESGLYWGKAIYFALPAYYTCANAT